MDQPGRLLILGDPVSQSRSPVFQNAALKAANIALTYEALRVTSDHLEEVLRQLGTERAAGNVTIPHKQAVFGFCTRTSELAARVGAVNTFWHEDGELIGDNTDVAGAEVMIRALLGDSADKADATLVGAGGSAAAVLAAAERCGIRQVRIYNRNPERARSLASRFPAIAVQVADLGQALAGARLVINATPLGLHDATFPVALEMLPDGCAVFDLVYKYGETAWVAAARAAGHRAADGEGMLIEQGAIAFQRWFGFAPDINAMWKAIR